VVGRSVVEPERFTSAAGGGEGFPILGAVAPPHRRRLLVLAGIIFAISVVTGPANSFFFLYAEDVLDLAESVTAVVVVVAGAAGLAGLLLGRAVADRLGRRAAVAAALVLVPAAGVLTYSGSVPAVVTGYLLAVLTGSAFLPAMGSLQAELFPTSVRSAVAGWLVTAGVLGSFVGLLAFGLVADADDRFGLAAAVVFVPATLAAGLVVLLPETRGWDLDEARG
jgi:predicted MFS family arabinose efflux permease